MAEQMRVNRLDPEINLLDVAPPMAGFSGFLGAYVIQGHKTAVIDPGPASSIKKFLDGLAELNIAPGQIDYILASHIHLDHTGGLGHLIKLAPQAQIIVHEKGRSHLINPSRLWQGSLQVLGQMARDYGEPEPVPEDRIIPAEDGLKIDLDGLVLEALTTPGHATHHLSFFDRQNGRLFAGECAGVVFSDLEVCLPSTPSPFDLNRTLESLEKMLSLQPSTIYYAHLGCFPEAAKRIREFRQNLLLYGRIISQYPPESVTAILDEFLDTLKAKDQFYQTSPERLKVRLHFMRANILGYQGYLQQNRF